MAVGSVFHCRGSFAVGEQRDFTEKPALFNGINGFVIFLDGDSATQQQKEVRANLILLNHGWFRFQIFHRTFVQKGESLLEAYI